MSKGVLGGMAVLLVPAVGSYLKRFAKNLNHSFW